MDRRNFMKLGAAATTLGPGVLKSQTPVPPLPAPGADGWVSLINGRDLKGWYTMLEKSGKNVAEGRKMVTFEQGMLHIMGSQVADDNVEPGYLATTQEFENVHIRVEFKWGTRRFGARSAAKRDNGLLYGLVGEDVVWPRCIECQIEEGDVGDMIMVRGIRGVQGPNIAGVFGVGLDPDKGWSTPGPLGRATYQPPANGVAANNSIRLIKDGNFENLNDWNTVEVVWQGDRAAHIVNGRTVNVAYNLQQPDPNNPGQFIPLTRGKIALEFEYAETWFRRVEVKSLIA